MMSSEQPAPHDDDLVAYLDGELGDAEARAMERLLASDPHAAARANALRKTFDLLTHLPVPQPSSTFITRTLTQLQTRLIPAKPQMPWLHWLWPMAASLAAFAVGVTVQRFTAPGETAPVTHTADSLDDLPVVESLPIYQGIDDVASLQSLVQSGAFSNENRDVLPSPPIKRSADELQQWIDTFRALTPARQQQLRRLIALCAHRSDATRRDRAAR